jgi:hypothetical protein
MRARLGTVVGALVLLALARLLPASGIGLYLRLAAATGVVLLPGRLLVGAGMSATLGWSVGAVAVALAVTFVVHGSLTLVLVLLAALTLALIAWSPRPAELPGKTPALVLVAGAVFGIALWHVLGTVQGDALFHLGRVRKLAELGGLSLRSVDEFKDGGLHPGYAFPLWHGVLALVSRLSGVDPTLVVRYEASVLCPIAFVAGYEAGKALFKDSWLAATVLAGSLGLIVLAPGSGGALKSLALPATVALYVFVPAALALFFSPPSRFGYATLAVLSLDLALIHPSYAPFLLVPLAGYLVARALLGGRADVPAIAGSLAAVGIPTAGMLVWLLPIVRETASSDLSGSALTGSRHGIARYADQLNVISASSFRLRPEVIDRRGAVAIAALALVPLAAVAWRRRWAAFVLGGTLAVLAILLVPFVFPHFAGAVSLSQARRLAAFLPLPFAFAGGAWVLARLLRIWVLPLALATGIWLQLAWPGDFNYTLKHGGPALATWIAAFGGLAALVAAAAIRRTDLRGGSTRLAALAAGLFLLPVAVHGLSHWTRPTPQSSLELTSGLVHALRVQVPRRAVVFSDLETSYRISAFAPVYVAAAPPPHVADTTPNHPYKRATDVRAFFAHPSLAIPRRYGAGWLVVDRRHFPVSLPLRPVYQDARFALYKLRLSAS